MLNIKWKIKLDYSEKSIHVFWMTFSSNLIIIQYLFLSRENENNQQKKKNMSLSGFSYNQYTILWFHYIKFFLVFPYSIKYYKMLNSGVKNIILIRVWLTKIWSSAWCIYFKIEFNIMCTYKMLKTAKV